MPNRRVCCSATQRDFCGETTNCPQTSSNQLSGNPEIRRCSTMKRVSEFALVSLFVLASSGGLHPQSPAAIVSDSDLDAANTHPDLSAIPPLPSGKSTILGGAIHDVDPVLDRFSLRIVGEKPITILFDERTQVFLDGKKIPLLDLRPASHASVQTILDGTSVFALSVHI